MISDCGELAPGEDEGVCSADDSGDQIPDWPEDSQVDFSNVHTSIFDFFFLLRLSNHYLILNAHCLVEEPFQKWFQNFK